MKRDPLNIALTLIYNLNLVEENRELNINNFKSLRDLTNHWNTIKKYMKIFQLVQKYCPDFEINDSKIKVLYSEIYNRFSMKEKLILYLMNNNAFSKEDAVQIGENISEPGIVSSIGYLYERTENGKYYLRKSGIDKYKLIEQSLSDLIYNEKEIDEVFESEENYIEFDEQIDFSNVDFIIHKNLSFSVDCLTIPSQENETAEQILVDINQENNTEVQVI